jgi:tRNA-specific 2-thiouridylase
MRNWDEREETGNIENCSVERDARDAAAVAKKLDIPFTEADFVSKYWVDVFQDFLHKYSQGLTPNPDLACNRNIKFGALVHYAMMELDVKYIATGHYARIQSGRKITTEEEGGGEGGEGGNEGENHATTNSENTIELLRGVDERKDQSYFLATIHRQALHHTLFPIGHLLKPQVKQLATEAGLHTTVFRRSSAGICFVGRRRNFAQFLEQYLPPVTGRFIDVDNGLDIGECKNLLALTHGQKAGLAGAVGKLYVVGKDMVRRIVYVAVGRGHPALFSRRVLVKRPAEWLVDIGGGASSSAAASSTHNDNTTFTGGSNNSDAVSLLFRCQYKCRYGQQAKWCTVYQVNDDDDREEVVFERSRFTRLHGDNGRIENGWLIVEFDEPQEAITPGQAFVMYNGEVCLGAGEIVCPGETEVEKVERGEVEVDGEVEGMVWHSV